MASIIVLFGKPQDPKTFDELYRKEHIPLAMKIPGLKRFTVHKVAPPPGREPAYYQVVEMVFEDMESLKRATRSPESAESTRHATKIATGGMTFLYTESSEAYRS